jgi:hypothetical protein
MYQFYFSYTKFLVNAAVYSGHAQVIRCDIKRGSVERSIGLDKEGLHHYEFLRFLLVCCDSKQQK